MGYDTGEVYQSNSDFLKAEDIGANFWTATISAIDMKNFDDGSRKLMVSFQELDKNLVLNKTNADTISDLYGRNTDGWQGRQVMLFTMPVDYQGKKVQAVRVRAPATTGAPQRQPGQLQPGQPPAQAPYNAAQHSPQRPINPQPMPVGAQPFAPLPDAGDEIPF